MPQQTIGIIGGVGPRATIELERRLLALAEARADQDYPKIISYNNSSIPDRTAALLRGGQDPLPALIHTAEVLVRSGATVLCLPCNTAHAFLLELQRASEVPIINMVEEACAVAAVQGKGKRIGILCTDGTRIFDLYGQALSAKGCLGIYPGASDQQLLSELIYGEKGLKVGFINEPSQQLQEIIDRLEGSVDTIILACSELSLANVSSRVPLVDALHVLAERAFCFYPQR